MEPEPPSIMRCLSPLHDLMNVTIGVVSLSQPETCLLHSLLLGAQLLARSEASGSLLQVPPVSLPDAPSPYFSHFSSPNAHSMCTSIWGCTEGPFLGLLGFATLLGL